MSKNTVIVVRGVLNYAKVLGKARPHTGLPKYDKGPYWSVDVAPDKASLAMIETVGVTSKLKEPSDKDKNRVGKDKYLSLKVLLNKSDGDTNDPPRVVDAQGNQWPENKLIGNGTVADVKIKVVDYGRASEKGTYVQAIRVLDLVPYESSEFAPLSEDDAFFAAPEEDQGVTGPIEDEDLDDDIPF